MATGRRGSGGGREHCSRKGPRDVTGNPHLLNIGETSDLGSGLPPREGFKLHLEVKNK